MKFSAYKWFALSFSTVIPSPHSPYRVPVSLLHAPNPDYDSYHMQYFHGMSYCLAPFVLDETYVPLGIAASTARPFSPPTAFRTTPRQRPGKLERTHMLEGRCHRCARWVPVQGVKDADAKVWHRLSPSIDF
jgi:hypothetical protein